MLKHITQDFLGNRLSRAIGWPFLGLGLLFGTWATFIPYVKDKFQLNDADLGLLLLSMPMGALLMNSVGAILIRKVGMQKATLIGFTLMCFAFALPLNLNVFLLLPFALFLCGSGISITNVAMNTAVSALEDKFKINIISTCHGLFSIGLMLSSLAASYARGINVPPGIYMIVAATLVFAGGIVSAKSILSISNKQVQETSESKTRFLWPTGALLIMILIGLCNNIAEGTMADWSSVYMREIVHTSPYFVGWGLAAYSLFMALGRFFGDGIIPRFGANKVLVYGAVLALSGIVVIVILPYLMSSILGFAMVGAGVSCVAPILYASSARVPGMAEGSGLALMNTFAMTGFMAGPVVIGFISELVSLPFAFMVVAFLCFIWLLLARKAEIY